MTVSELFYHFSCYFSRIDFSVDDSPFRTVLHVKEDGAAQDDFEKKYAEFFVDFWEYDVSDNGIYISIRRGVYD